MPQFSKKANLVKELKAIVQYRTLKGIFVLLPWCGRQLWRSTRLLCVGEVGPFEVYMVCLSESISNME